MDGKTPAWLMILAFVVSIAVVAAFCGDYKVVESP